MKRPPNDLDLLVDLDEKGEKLATKKCYFRWLVMDMVEDLMQSDDDRIEARYCNKKDPLFGNKTLAKEMRKQLPPIQISKSFKQVGIKFHPNNICPQVKHVPVLT